MENKNRHPVRKEAGCLFLDSSTVYGVHQLMLGFGLKLKSRTDSALVSCSRAGDFVPFRTCRNIPLIVKNSPSINKTRIADLNTMIIIMDLLPVEHKHSDIVVVGGDSSLQYLLERFAEQIGYTVSVENDPSSADAIRQSEPVAVIFPSVEILEGVQTLAVELTNCDIPIIVCSSVLDQAKTRELGADYCLLHPLVFDSFSSTLQTIVASQHESRLSHGEVPGSLPINPA